jgi:hypothetical protein
MRIRLNSVYAGPAGCYDAGTVVDFSDAEARALIAGRYAEAVDAPAPGNAATPEVAITEEVGEAAVAPNQVRRGPGRPRG